MGYNGFITEDYEEQEQEDMTGMSVSPLSSLKERRTKRGKTCCRSELEQQLLWESTFPLEAIIWRCYHCPTSPWSSRDSQGDFAVLAVSMMSCAIWAQSSRVIGRQHVSAEVKKMHLFCCHGFSRLLKLLAWPVDRPAFVWKRITPDDCVYPKLHSWHVSRLGKESYKCINIAQLRKKMKFVLRISLSLCISLCWVFDLGASFRPPDIECVLRWYSLVSCFALNFCFWISLISLKIQFKCNKNSRLTCLQIWSCLLKAQSVWHLHCCTMKDSFYTSYLFS